MFPGRTNGEEASRGERRGHVKAACEQVDEARSEETLRDGISERTLAPRDRYARRYGRGYGATELWFLATGGS